MRLEPFQLTKVKSSVSYFNSIKVQLEQLDGEVEDLLHNDFNSIKVQLERFINQREVYAHIISIP